MNDENNNEDDAPIVKIFKSLGISVGFIIAMLVIYEAVKWIVVLILGVWIVGWIMDLITISVS